MVLTCGMWQNRGANMWDVGERVSGQFLRTSRWNYLKWELENSFQHRSLQKKVSCATRSSPSPTASPVVLPQRSLQVYVWIGRPELWGHRQVFKTCDLYHRNHKSRGVCLQCLKHLVVQTKQCFEHWGTVPTKRQCSHKIKMALTNSCHLATLWLSQVVVTQDKETCPARD